MEKGIGEGEGLLLMDGYNDCIAGVIERFNAPDIICYDKQKVLKKLQEDGMSEEEAEEFYSYNQLGAWMGELTPCFIKPLPEGILDEEAE